MKKLFNLYIAKYSIQILLLTICFSSNTAFSQLEKVILENKLDSTMGIRFELGDSLFDATRIRLSIATQSYKSDGWYYGKAYDLYQDIYSFPASKDLRIDTSEIFSPYKEFFFLLEFLNMEHKVVHSKTYSNCAQKRYPSSRSRMLSFEFFDAQLKPNTCKDVYTVFGSRHESDPDPYWQIWYNKKDYSENAHNQDDLFVPYWSGHVLIKGNSLKNYPVKVSIYDDDFGRDDRIIHRTYDFGSIKTDSAFVKVISSKSLEKDIECKFILRDFFYVGIEKEYAHPDVKSFEFLSQKDTLVNGAMCRKIDLSIDNTLNTQKIEIAKNIDIDFLYLSDGKPSNQLFLNSEKFKFSLLYPSRNHLPKKELKLTLKDDRGFNFVDAIDVPRQDLDTLQFASTKIKLKTKKKDSKYYIMIYTGDYSRYLDSTLPEYTRDFRFDFDSKRNYYPWCKKKKYWKGNLHKDEVVTVLVYKEIYPAQLVGQWIGSVSKGKLRGRKILIDLDTGGKLKFRVRHRKYCK